VAKNRSAVFLIAIALAAALGGALIARHVGRATIALQNGTWLPAARAIAPFALTDHLGQPFGNARLLGHPSLLFFGFTHCPDVCPTTLALLSQLQRTQPLPGLQLLFVTVDPQRDDPVTLQRYVNAFGSGWVGLRGADPQLDSLLHSLSAVRFVQDTPGGSYTVDHSSTLYLIDGKGQLAAVFTPPFALPALESDLRQAARALDQ
jgi:protein SCO1/2